MIQREVYAVFFGGDRVLVGFADHADAGRVEFIPAGRPGVGADHPVESQCSLLAEVLNLQKRFIAHRRLGHDRLDKTGAVTERQEVEFSARPAVVEPALQGDRLAFEFGNVLDVCHGCS